MTISIVPAFIAGKRALNSSSINFFLSNKDYTHGPICNVDAPREQNSSS